tara:strand:- start:5 stop:523 length:519 start_codon:yes stop_codon:yes gene_type:complete
MVHRIQNRNPGYSDFGNSGLAQSFNFSSTMSSPVSHGANALKLENEVTEEAAKGNNTSNTINSLNNEYNEALLYNQEIESVNTNNQKDDYEHSFAEEARNLIDKNEESNSSLEAEQNLNGLENFGVEDKGEPDLFSSDNNEVTSETFLSTENNENASDDDLEIPAFLRRQKN